MLLTDLGPIIVILIVILATVSEFVSAYRYGKQLDAGNKPLAPVRQVNLEDGVDDILARYRQERRSRRARQKIEWDEKYLLSLPVEEHPDYFELDLKSDDVEEYVQKTANGEICHSSKSRRNSRGVPYSLEIDHITQTASVSTGKISWEVPLSRVDNWKELA